MLKIKESAMELAVASEGNPVSTTIVVMLFYLFSYIAYCNIKTLIWGDSATHWIDPFFTFAFIAYAAYCVYACACVNTVKKQSQNLSHSPMHTQ